MAEHFLLTPAECALVDTCRGDVNRHGMAVLLKTVQYLGYFPAELSHVPEVVRTFIAHQLQLLWDHTPTYPRHPSTRDVHVALIRQHTGCRFPTGEDKQALERWLQTHGAPNAPTEEAWRECAYTRLRALGVELPAPHELHRIAQAALRRFFQDVYDRVAARLSVAVRTALDALLVVPPEETRSLFDQLKAEPTAPGVQPLQQEVMKLQALRAAALPADALADVPLKVVQLLKRRAHTEDASRMRAHPASVRYTLLASFVRVRAMEVTDDAVRMTLEVIRRLETQTEQHLEKTLLHDIKRVAGKVQLLYRIAEAVVEAPDGTIRNVLFPCVTEDTFHDLVAEAHASHPRYRIWYQAVMRQKFVRHYRRMLPLVLEHLTFRSENRFQPVIEALAVIQQSLGTKGRYFPADVPLEGVVLPSWRETVIEAHAGTTRINRPYYELCVLQRLERALKCKKIWVEGAYAFRNPGQDLPANWRDEDQRRAYYGTLQPPREVTSFLAPLRHRLTQALTQLNRDLPRNPQVHLSTPAANEDRRLFAVAPLIARPEPQRLGHLKDLIGQRYGMLDLLDIVLEADRLVDFTRFFTHAGTKEVRSREARRPLVLLDVFAEGTNTGIKRVANANQRYGFHELLYVWP